MGNNKQLGSRNFLKDSFLYYCDSYRQPRIKHKFILLKSIVPAEQFSAADNIHVSLFVFMQLSENISTS